MGRLSENSVLNLKNKSHSVTAEVEVPAGGANGVIIAQGGAFAGWSLYLHEGKPKYCHNLARPDALLRRGFPRRYRGEAPGADGVHLRRRRPGQGRYRRALRRRGKVGEGRVDATVPMVYSGDETCDVGATPARPSARTTPSAANEFTGTVNWVELEAGEDNHDHLISPEHLMRVAMALQ